jgi:hypothetical protein
MLKRVALVVGIANYEHYETLECCPPSAQDVHELLVSPELGGCDPERSVLIMKTTKEDGPLMISDLDDAVRQVMQSLEPGDQFIFFFCGHAEVYKDRLFLILTKSQQDKPLQSYNFSDLVEKLSLSNIDKGILIVDACHSEVMFNSVKDLQGDWSPTNLPTGIGFMAACGKIQSAKQSQKLKRTFFSYYLCEGIRNWTYTRCQFITLLALQDYINQQMRVNHPEESQRALVSIYAADRDLWLSSNPSYSPRSENAETLEKRFDPFKAGGLVYKADEFVGRKAVLKLIFPRIVQGKPTILVGWSSVGKSSLLKQLIEISKIELQKCGAKESDFIFHLIDCNDFHFEAATPSSFWRWVLEPLCSIYLSEEITHLVKEARENGFAPPSLKSLFVSLGRSGKRVVLLIDDFPILASHPNFSTDFFDLLRSMTVSIPSGLVLVLTSRQYPSTLSQLLSGSSTHDFFEGFECETLEPFSKEDVVQLLERGMGLTNISFGNQDVIFVFTVTGGHPYLVQCAASSLWEVATAPDSPTTNEDRYFQAGRSFHDKASTHFAYVWQQHLQPFEKRAITIVGLAQIYGQLKGRIFEVEGFGTLPKFFGRAVTHLRRNRVVEIVDRHHDNRSGLVRWGKNVYRIAAEGFTWWLLDKLSDIISKEEDFPSWLGTKSLPQSEWETIERWTNEVLELTEYGTEYVGVEALMKATAENITRVPAE